MTAEFNIESKTGGYPVLLGPGLLDQTGAILAGRTVPGKIALISDQTVAALYLERLSASLTKAGYEVHAIIVPSGEKSKSFARLEEICRELLKNHLEKEDLVIALGGGVVGDLAGLAASLTRRGLRLVMAPTTLLAQADSSIGGKTAINTPEGKNLIGAIHAPMLVLDDISTLATLPPEELSAGYAEVIKHAILDGDEHFSYLEKSADAFFAGDEQVRLETISKSIRFKGGIVERDETDQGLRHVLNLGHTFGHALEGVTGPGGGLGHGSAVAVGLSMAFEFARFTGCNTGDELIRVTTLLKKAGLPTTIREAGIKCRSEDLKAFMRQDKKNKGGLIRLIVPHGFGDIYTKEMTGPKTLEQFFQALNI
jgi:3-dehydroquinate synthase